MSRLYRSLEDYDVVRGIFGGKVGTKSVTCAALQAEAKADYAEAVKLYNEVRGWPLIALLAPPAKVAPVWRVLLVLLHVFIVHKVASQRRSFLRRVRTRPLNWVPLVFPVQALNREQWDDGEPAECERDFWEMAAMEAYSHLTEWKSLQYCSTLSIDKASPPNLQMMWSQPVYQVSSSPNGPDCSAPAHHATPWQHLQPCVCDRKCTCHT